MRHLTCQLFPSTVARDLFWGACDGLCLNDEDHRLMVTTPTYKTAKSKLLHQPLRSFAVQQRQHLTSRPYNLFLSCSIKMCRS